MTWGDPLPRTLSDAQVEVIDFLSDLTSHRVGAFYPTESTPEAPVIPYVAVADDGSPSSTAVSANTTVRVTVWDENPGPAKTEMRRLRGELLAHPGSDKINSIRRGIISAPVPDDRTPFWLASFTVIVSARSV